MNEPTCLNSATPKPRLVLAGVPRRMPEVMVGFCVSNGTPFLLQVMWARDRGGLGGLAGEALPLKIDQHQVVVGAARGDVVAAGR